VRKVLWILVNEKTRDIKHFEQVDWQPVPDAYSVLKVAEEFGFKEVKSGVGRSLIAGIPPSESLVDSNKAH
jgi:hypothetical protein